MVHLPENRCNKAENDITASSQFGVNGTVDIHNFGLVANKSPTQVQPVLTCAIGS